MLSGEACGDVLTQSPSLSQHDKCLTLLSSLYTMQQPSQPFSVLLDNLEIHLIGYFQKIKPIETVQFVESFLSADMALH